MDLTLFRDSLERACLQVRSEYLLYPGEEGLNMALAKLKGIVAGCFACSRWMKGDAGAAEMLEMAREITGRYQRELVQEG